MPNTLKQAYADNGANGDNVRRYVGRETHFDSSWNPVYCVYGWPHITWPGEENKCFRCEAERREQ